MKVSTGEWDVRCPGSLKKLFPKRKGFYYRINRDTAGKVLEILSAAYEIPAPDVDKIPKGRREYAMYDYETRTVLLYHRNHIKSVFHEFYHHLDNVTGGEYDSDDRNNDSTSLAWIFADKLWAKFRSKEEIPGSH